VSQTATQLAGRALSSSQDGSRAWWFLGTLAVLRNPEGAPRTPAVIELTVPPGGSPPAHVHEDLDDSFLVLDGEIVLRCADRIEVARAGSYVVLPHGVEHTFRVTGARPAKLLLVHADDSFLRFIEAVGTPTDQRTLPPPGTPTPAGEEIAQSSAAHGARFVGPSLESVDIPPSLIAQKPTEPILRGVHHISLIASDLAASERWYTTAFDLVRVDGDIAEDGSGHLVLLNPATGWMVTLAGPAEPCVEHIAIGCDDRESLAHRRETLIERGITPGDITDAPYGSGFVLRDPDGIEMELFAPPTPA
jgi:mannose-6-phosphate isomerase-like protein (cupin superfamily)/catechol 2,3-dioxygenase-like lactoylglutathione lyase family enzyme